MSGAKTKASENTAQEQLGLGRQQQGYADEDRARMFDLIQPVISLNKALATGDREKSLSLMAPVIGQISSTYGGANDAIFNSIEPGPARDFALAQLERERRASIGSALTQPFIQSFDKLASIGSGLGSFSLQELGAGLRGFEGASITQDSVMKAQAANKAATMGFLGQLAGIAGSAATGGLSGGSGGGLRTAAGGAITPAYVSSVSGLLSPGAPFTGSVLG